MTLPYPWPAARARLGVLSNPNSGRNRQGQTTVDALLRERPDVVHREAGTPAQVATALAELAAAHIDVLAVNAGDGTVQAVLSALHVDHPFQEVPVLALLRGGTTNMTAGDVGLRGGHVRALKRLLAWTHDSTRLRASVVQRPVLRLQLGQQARPHFGMFFGAGAIVKGIEHCHASVHSKGLRDGIAPGVTTLRMVLAALRDDRRYIEPVPMALELRWHGRDAKTRILKDDYLLVLVSSLRKLFLGLKPFWGERTGALHFTSLRARPTRLLRSLPPLFWGRAGATATPENGYYSSPVDALQLTMDGPLTLDGEIYHAIPANGPVQVSSGPLTRFLVL